MEDGGNVVVALKDCGGAAALGGGVGWWFKITAAAVGRGNVQQWHWHQHH